MTMIRIHDPEDNRHDIPLDKIPEFLKTYFPHLEPLWGKTFSDLSSNPMAPYFKPLSDDLVIITSEPLLTIKVDLPDGTYRLQLILINIREPITTLLPGFFEADFDI